LAGYVEREFEVYLKCGRLEHGFLRVGCETCHAESAALLVDEVFPAQPVRQWVLSLPFPLRCLFASRAALMSKVLGRRVPLHCHALDQTARIGAVTLIQRFGSALNLNVHFHILFLDGLYVDSATGASLRFRWVKAPTRAELNHLTHTIARRVGRFLERQREGSGVRFCNNTAGRAPVNESSFPAHRDESRNNPLVWGRLCSVFVVWDCKT